VINELVDAINGISPFENSKSMYKISPMDISVYVDEILVMA
jgi:hypothetical protein